MIVDLLVDEFPQILVNAIKKISSANALWE